MLKSPENLCRVLDALTSDPNVSRAARSIGATTMTVYRWLKLSRDGAPEFQNLEWSNEVGSFHQFFEYAQRALINEIEQTAKANALGVDEVVVFQGQVQFKQDPKLIGESDDPDVLEMLFGVRDKFLRIDGEVQPLTVRRKASDALVIKMLSSHKPEIYGDKSTVNVNMKVGGVLRLARAGEAPVKTLEQQSDGSFGLDDTSAADEVDTTTMLALGRPAETSEEFDKWVAEGEFAPAPVTIAPPVAPHDDPTNPITKAVRAAEAARAENIKAGIVKPPQSIPVPPEMRPDPDADLDDVSGQRVKAAPPSADNVEALIADIRQRMVANTPLDARSRQVAQHLARGNTETAEALAKAMVGPSLMAEGDHLGPGTKPKWKRGSRVV